MSFLPTNYTIPTTSRYVKLKQGANKFRVLDSAITGYEWWTDVDGGRKPNRRATFKEAIKEGVEPIKHFWAFTVWSYEESSVQVMEVTQKTIMNALKALVENEEWGDPKTYDITVTRAGEGMETEYTITPSPKKPMPAEAKTEMEELKPDLTALYTGGDPFAPKETSEDIAEDVAKALN